MTARPSEFLSTPTILPKSQEAVFRFLADPKTHGLSEPVVRVDTANAVVFLAGADVYKLKRAVKFPFMDLSTLDKRREACEAEIAVNRPLAPDIYLAALPIVRQGETFAIGGDGEVVEWVVHMRRFDENATLDHVADRGGVSDAVIDRLALADPPHARSRPAQGRRARRAFARNLHRAEPRRFRRAARSLRSADGGQAHRRVAARIRRPCARSCSSAARPVSFAAVTAICI